MPLDHDALRTVCKRNEEKDGRKKCCRIHGSSKFCQVCLGFMEPKTPTWQVACVLIINLPSSAFTLFSHWREQPVERAQQQQLTDRLQIAAARQQDT